MSSSDTPPPVRGVHVEQCAKPNRFKAFWKNYSVGKVLIWLLVLHVLVLGGIILYPSIKEYFSPAEELHVRTSRTESDGVIKTTTEIVQQSDGPTTTEPKQVPTTVDEVKEEPKPTTEQLLEALLQQQTETYTLVKELEVRLSNKDLQIESLKKAVEAMSSDVALARLAQAVWGTPVATGENQTSTPFEVFKSAAQSAFTDPQGLGATFVPDIRDGILVLKVAEEETPAEVAKSEAKEEE